MSAQTTQRMNPTAAPALAAGAAPSVQPLARFDAHKRHASRWAARWGGDPRATAMAAKFSRCAEVLGLVMELAPDRPAEAKLQNAHFCGSRFCPFCEWRRASRWRRRLIPGLQAFHLEHPNHKAVFLTLTVQNVRQVEIRETIQAMHKAWHRLQKRAEFPTQFWLRRTEITLGRPPSAPDAPACPWASRVSAGTDGNSQANAVAPIPKKGENREHKLSSSKLVSTKDVSLYFGSGAGSEPSTVWLHPHIHALLLVPARYFTADYVRQGRWRELWMDAARLDYAPVVDVRAVRVKRGADTVERRSIAAAIEAAKYTAKPADMLALGPLVPDLTARLHKMRMISVSRPLAQYVRPDSPQGDELTDAPEIDYGSGFGQYVVARWDEQSAHYMLDP